MQSETSIQLTQVPPQPRCTQIFNTGSCADLWRNYKQAVQQRTREELQLYVNRQKEVASSQATAPLQQQIADLNTLVADQQRQIKKMQEQMQADSAAALRASSAAHTEGLQWGTGIGVGAALLLLGVGLGVRKLTRTFTLVEKARAASA
jgi:hypothetical protein